MADEAERMQILEMIESGKISAEDGLTLLRALVSNQADMDDDEVDIQDDEDETYSASNLSPSSSLSSNQTVIQNESRSYSKTAGILADEISQPLEISGQVSEAAETQPARSIPEETQKWRRFWMLPFWLGVIVLIIGGGLMYWTLDTRGVGVTFILASIPFILGLGIMLISWQSRTAPWIHIRITQPAGEKPERIALSFPLPIRPALWFFRTFSGHIPKMQDISLDEILIAVNQSTNADNPIYVQVDEGDKGEKVEIYIG